MTDLIMALDSGQFDAVLIIFALVAILFLRELSKELTDRGDGK